MIFQNGPLFHFPNSVFSVFFGPRLGLILHFHTSFCLFTNLQHLPKREIFLGLGLLTFNEFRFVLVGLVSVMEDEEVGCFFGKGRWPDVDRVQLGPM